MSGRELREANNLRAGGESASADRPADSAVENEEEILRQVRKALRTIRYGYIEITVQGSKVVQMNVTKKIRLDRQKSTGLEGGDGI